ncbi:hypothetical protein NQZ68_038116 [Dissostichus eleginoides]|nr:hypothetical protein NQZ68_038116 [Dissostichus eleginoides]
MELGVEDKETRGVKGNFLPALSSLPDPDVPAVTDVNKYKPHHHMYRPPPPPPPTTLQQKDCSEDRGHNFSIISQKTPFNPSLNTGTHDLQSQGQSAVQSSTVGPRSRSTETNVTATQSLSW